jgi:hypothetical protein
MGEMSEMIFAAPWWLPILLGLIAVVLLWTGARRQQPGMKAAGLVVVGVGILIIVLSALVETDREIVQRQTREFVAAVEEGDWPTVSSLLHPNASAAVLGAELSISPREQIVQVAEAATSDYGLNSVRIRSLRLEQADTLMTAHLDAFTDQDATPYPNLPSSWQLDWQQTAEGWFLHRITLVQIGQRSGDQVGRQVPRP